MTQTYFVVDTDQYAGNFERAMCAYMTGQVGECGVGSELAEQFASDAGPSVVSRMEQLVGSQPDDSGCWRPCTIYPNPAWFNNGRGGHYRVDAPNSLEIAQHDHDVQVIQSADDFLRVYAHMPDYAERQAADYMSTNFGTKVQHYPAYMSVAIVLNDVPTVDDIEFLKRRATEFVANHRSGWGNAADPITIEGFRLVTERTVVESEAV